MKTKYKIAFYSHSIDYAGTWRSHERILLNLNQEIPNGVNLDYFLLRRYVEDPSSIILDVNFPLTDNSSSINSAGNGILKPQYITKELESGIDTIIQNLKNQNLI